MGGIRPLPPLDAPAEILADARENCAARYRAKGQHEEAEAFAAGLRDGCWAHRYEVVKLLAEAAHV